MGSPLRGDDRVGLVVCSELEKCGVPSVSCEYGLETCLAEITELRPKRLLVVDAVVANSARPGDILAVEPGKAADPRPITTHSIPLELSLRLLSEEAPLEEVLVAGIAVKDVSVSLDISPEVLDAARALSAAICEALGERKREEGE